MWKVLLLIARNYAKRGFKKKKKKKKKNREREREMTTERDEKVLIKSQPCLKLSIGLYIMMACVCSFFVDLDTNKVNEQLILRIETQYPLFLLQMATHNCPHYTDEIPTSLARRSRQVYKSPEAAAGIPSVKPPNKAPGCSTYRLYSKCYVLERRRGLCEQRWRT
jgi:hypothetical protein